MPAEKIQVCSEKQRLLSELDLVHVRISSIHSRGDYGTDDSLENELNQALSRKAAILQQLTRHMNEHHC